MVKLSIEISGDRFVFPAFKFLSDSHPSSMLERGNVHPPTLQEFRDPSWYKGTIHDLKEGWIRLECFYSFFSGLAKDADGTIPLIAPPYSQVVVHTSTTQPVDIDSGNLFIYCMTQFLLSDSLRWAIGERKTSCVMVTNVELFLKRITESIANDSLQFVGVENCIYANRGGRTILDMNPTRNSIANSFLRDPITVAFTKPVSHSNQRELRAIWQKQSDEIIAPVTLDKCDVTDLCIPVGFSAVDVNILQNPPDSARIGTRIHRNSTDFAADFKFGRPWEVCSPVIYEFPGKPAMLGFHLDGNHNSIEDGEFRHSEIGILHSEIGPIFCCVPLDDVKSIEFFHT